MLKEDCNRLKSENEILGKRSDGWDTLMGKLKESLKERDMKIVDLEERVSELLGKNGR